MTNDEFFRKVDGEFQKVNDNYPVVYGVLVNVNPGMCRYCRFCEPEVVINTSTNYCYILNKHIEHLDRRLLDCPLMVTLITKREET